MNLIAQIGIVLAAAAILATLGRRLKQPPLVSYLLIGILIGVLGFNFKSVEGPEVVREIGIILLLFIAGLEIKLKNFGKTGLPALAIGLGQIILMGVVSFFVVRKVLGSQDLASIYLALGLTFSSSIVTIKSLEERKEMGDPHGQIIIGIMLLQDLVAVLALTFLATLGPANHLFTNILTTFGKGVGLLILFFLLGRYPLRFLFKEAAKSLELIFLAGLAWCFGAAALGSAIGFSPAIAAFLAGLAISEMDFSLEIRDKTRHLRDLGLLLFFVSLGISYRVPLSLIWSREVLLLTGFEIIGSVFILSFLGSFTRLPKRSVFLTALMPAQVSEFALILGASGLALGYLNERQFSILVLVALLSIIFSSLLIASSGRIFRLLSKPLKILEWRGHPHRFVKDPELKDHVVILGFGSFGQKAAETFLKEGSKVLVVDWNPKNLQKAKDAGCLISYGDASDPEVWERISLKNTSKVISAFSRNEQEDKEMIGWLKHHQYEGEGIAECETEEEANKLKDLGFKETVVSGETAWLELQHH